MKVRVVRLAGVLSSREAHAEASVIRHRIERGSVPLLTGWSAQLQLASAPSEKKRIVQRTYYRGMYARLREHFSDYRRKRHAANPEAKRAYDREWHAKNRERRLEARRKRYKERKRNARAD